MRYPDDHKQATRQRILTAAGRVFRRKGHAGAGVDEIMREAGLTPGGFYAHFRSKDELFREALDEAVRETRTVEPGLNPALSGAALLQAIAARYLNLGHCKHIEAGCPMPPLVADLPRQSAATRRGFEQAVGNRLASLAPHFAECHGMPDADWAYLAMLVGGVSLARAVSDDALADRIVAACRSLLNDALAPKEPAASPATTRRRITNTARKKSVRKPRQSKG